MSHSGYKLFGMKKRLFICVVLSFAVWNVFSSEREVKLVDKGWSFIQKDVANGKSVKLNGNEWTKVRK